MVAGREDRKNGEVAAIPEEKASLSLRIPKEQWCPPGLTVGFPDRA
jgi:hypothetical protein